MTYALPTEEELREFIWNAEGFNEEPTPDTLRKAAAVLESGVNRLDQHGWIQGSVGSEERGYCAIGAIGAANVEGNDSAYRYATDVLTMGVIRAGALGFNTIPDYNDAKGRTKRQVSRKMRAAARRCRALARSLEAGKWTATYKEDQR